MTDGTLDGDSRRPGMSGGTKVVLFLVGGAATACLICCGVAGFFFWKLKGIVENAQVTDPVKVVQAARDIVEMTIPPEFEPKQAVNLLLAKTVSFELKGNPLGSLQIAEFIDTAHTRELIEKQQELAWQAAKAASRKAKQATPPPIAGQPDAPEAGAEEPKADKLEADKPEAGSPDAPEMEQAAADEEEKDAPEKAPAVTEEHKTRDYDIRSQKVAVDFKKLTEENGSIMHHVTATFKGKNGLVTIVLILPDANYDEAKVDAMLKSIR